MANSENQTADNTTASTSTPLTAPAPAEYDSVEMKFRYKKTELGTQRQTVELKVPVPNVNGLIDIIQKGIEAGVDTTGKPNSKSIQLLLEVMQDTIRGSLAGFLGENETVVDASGVVFSKHTWDAIANTPKADRRSNQIPEEQWKSFVEDYVTVMPGVTGKTKEQVSNATTVFVKKFSIVKTNKPVIQVLKDQLALYVNNSPKAEEFSDIIELLNSKADAYLSSDDIQKLVANL